MRVVLVAVVVAFVAIAAALVTMCLCCPKLTLYRAQTLTPTTTSLPPTSLILTTTNSHQTRLFLPYNQRGQRENFARFMHAWSTRTGVYGCVYGWLCLSLSPPCQTRSQSHFRALSYVSCSPACLRPLVVCHFNWRVTKNSTLVYFIGTKIYMMPPLAHLYNCHNSRLLHFWQVFHFCIYCTILYYTILYRIVFVPSVCVFYK